MMLVGFTVLFVAFTAWVIREHREAHRYRAMAGLLETSRTSAESSRKSVE